MTKKIFAILVSLIIFLNDVSYCYADFVSYRGIFEVEAAKLKELGILNGTDIGSNLDKQVSRVEAAVMFVKLLGAEKEALDKKYKHPYTDVPRWANEYIGYLYKKGLINGISTTKFGSKNIIDEDIYGTYILKALGYDDSKGDFQCDKSLEYMNKMHYITWYGYREFGIDYAFRREDVVLLTYRALTMHLKDSNKTLIEKLVEDKAIDINKAEKIGLLITQENVEKTVNLTQEDLVRLKSYPYEKQEDDHFNNIIGYDEITVEYLNTIAPLVYENLFVEPMYYNYNYDAINKSIDFITIDLFDDNQKFITDKSLVYTNYIDNYAIRGILQTIHEDGRITEEDREYVLWYGQFGDIPLNYPGNIVRWYYKESKNLGRIRVITTLAVERNDNPALSVKP